MTGGNRESDGIVAPGAWEGRTAAPSPVALLAATLALAILVPAAPVTAAPAPASATPGREGGGAGAPDRGSIEQRIETLERLVASLKAEVESLRHAGAAPDGAAPTLQELEQRIEALSRELERLRIGPAAAPGAAGSVPGFGPAASKVYATRRGVSIGGYGEMLYQNFTARRDNDTPANVVDRFDLQRAVFYFGYKFNDRFVFNSEIEYEHAKAGDGAPGEAAVEFAYIDFRWRRSFGVRGGLLLVPVGFLNELHEPPIFFGARRPEVEQRIIPTTWRENGVGVYGDAGPVSYRAYLVTSLDASGFTPDRGIREGRQEGADAKADDLALTARVDYSPAPGLLLGAAAFTGRTGQGDAALPRARLTLYDLHAEWNWKALHLRGLYARSLLSDAGAISLALDGTGMTAIGERMQGWYGEIAWNLLASLRSTGQELSPFCRYESLDTQARVAPGFTADPENDVTVRTCGFSYRPIPNIALKIDAQDFSNRAHTAVDQVNVALGYLF
jgi:hypothetical protein